LLYVQVDTLLEISRCKKYSCEKCPFASGKRFNFQRHVELHGSRQRHTCLYCDYSVPSIILLQQHQKIHLMPNQNLLATQTFSNLQHLREVGAPRVHVLTLSLLIAIMRLLGSAPKSHLCDQKRRSKVTGLSDLMTLFIDLGCLYCKQTQRAFNVFKNTLNWLKIDSVDQKFN
jgi:hypothetical protein